MYVINGTKKGVRKLKKKHLAWFRTEIVEQFNYKSLGVSVEQGGIDDGV